MEHASAYSSHVKGPFTYELMGAPNFSTKCSITRLAHADFPGLTFLAFHHQPLGYYYTQQEVYQAQEDL